MALRLAAALLAITGVLAGCVNAPAAESGGGELGDAASGSLLLPTTEVIEGVVGTSVATPARTINFQGTFSQVFEVTENTTGFVFEVEWAPSTPASESLSVWIRAAGAGAVDPTNPPSLVANAPPITSASGAGPLRIAMAADQFPEAGSYEVIVRAAAEPVGVVVNQPFTLHLTTFADVAFDDAFSALGVPAEE